MIDGGIIKTTNIKLIGIRTPEKIPNALIGINGLKTLAKNATAVVLDVTVMALTPLLNEYAILLLFSLSMSHGSYMSYLITFGAMYLLCFQASTNTKMSSAAIPITKNIPIICKVPKKDTLPIPWTMTAVSGKLKKIMEIPTQDKNLDPK